MFRPGFDHFLKTAASLQWDEAGIDLRRDAAAWQGLEPERRPRLMRLLAGFCVGEARVAEELSPFALAASDQVAAACFRAQQRDEARHARFFDRVAKEVTGVPGGTEEERQVFLRAQLAPAFIALFEERLPAVTAALADGNEELDAAVGLYHLVLEGIVFMAGQLAVLELLGERDELPGLRHGVELVLRDERWHVGFGTRLLELARPSPATVSRLLEEGRESIASWGDAVDARTATRVAEIHRRRLRAARLLPGS
jgi:ribonucleoside-diphosphate reductase beta chain